jgi:hypothetical protein
VRVPQLPVMLAAPSPAPPASALSTEPPPLLDAPPPLLPLPLPPEEPIAPDAELEPLPLPEEPLLDARELLLLPDDPLVRTPSLVPEQ